MMQRFFRIFIIVYYIAISSLSASAFAAEERIVRIGSGDLMDGYYSIGLTLCRYISKSNNGIKCEVVPTTGSLENMQLLKENKIDFAFMLSNVAFDAYEGKGIFAKSGPFKNMYQLLNLYDEYFTVISKDSDKILVFSDLESKKISNGPPASDSSVIYNLLLNYYKFKQTPEDIEIFYENYAKEFCDGNIDAIMFMTGHPNSLINMITHKCESDFVTIDKSKIDLLIKDNPGFHKVILEKGKYPGITENQTTVAVKAIFVANKSTDRKIIENFYDYLKVRINNLKLSDPLLTDLDNAHFLKEFIIPGLNK